MAKITAIHSGGDWADASAEYLILPDGADIETLYANYHKWYKTVYRPARKRGEQPSYFSFTEWALDHGAREATEDELEVFDEENSYGKAKDSERCQ